MAQELLTQREYDRHLADGTLRLAFIGMSNVGKSYRAKVLEHDSDFMLYSVDDAIIEDMGFAGMNEISTWLGFPNSPDYRAREKEYLEHEAKHTKVDFLDTKGKNLVFDTTGSLIYLDELTSRWVKDNALIVNIDAGEAAIGPMIKMLSEQPKPLIWSDFYRQEAGESHEAALKRSYPALLHDRLRRYRALAHVNISIDELFDKSGTETSDTIRSYLPA